MPLSRNSLQIEPLTLQNWPLFEDLFGEKGACGGCWCMNWRVSASTFKAQKGSVNKRAFKKITSKHPPGLIAIREGRAIGWCAVAPRSDYPRLDNSRILAKVDDEPVWSISCFFIRKEERGKGLSRKLIQAAVHFAGKSGAKIVEAYPTAQAGKHHVDAFVWTGMEKPFLEEGFREVARRSPHRPVLRKKINIHL